MKSNSSEVSAHWVGDMAVTIVTPASVLANFALLLYSAFIFERDRANRGWLMGNIAVTAIALALTATPSLETGHFLCPAAAFFTKACGAVIGLSMAALGRERMSGTNTHRHPMPSVVAYIWAISMGTHLLDWIYTDYDEESGRCAALVIDRALALEYEIRKCVIFHLVVAAHFAYEIWKTREVVSLFNRFHDGSMNWQLEARLKTIRLLQLVLLSFILLWLPLGIVPFVHRVGLIFSKGDELPLETLSYGMWALNSLLLLFLPFALIWINKNLDFFRHNRLQINIRPRAGPIPQAPQASVPEMQEPERQAQLRRSNSYACIAEEIEEARYADAARHRLSLQTEPSFGEEIEMESFGGTSSLEVLPDSVCDMDTDSFSDGQSYGSQQRLVPDKPPNSLRETAV